MCVALGNRKLRGLCFNLCTEINKNMRRDSSGNISDLHLGADIFEFQPGYKRRWLKTCVAFFSSLDYVLVNSL